MNGRKLIDGRIGYLIDIDVAVEVDDEFLAWLKTTCGEEYAILGYYPHESERGEKPKLGSYAIEFYNVELVTLIKLSFTKQTGRYIFQTSK